MTLGDLIDCVEVQGKVHLSVWKDGEETRRQTIGFTEGLHRGETYRTNGERIYVSDYEDLEVTYLYTNDNGLTIEMKENEKYSFEIIANEPSFLCKMTVSFLST